MPPDFLTGHGFIQADAAMALLPPGLAPVVSVAPTSITAGMSATVTWSSINTTACAASGSWSGSLASNGSMSVTPAAAGTYTYTLMCSNPHGSTPSNSATLTVTAAPPPSSGGGGGGGLDGTMILMLAGLAGARWLRQARDRDRRSTAPDAAR